MCAATEPLGLLCYACYCYGSQMSQLDGTVGCIPPLDACMVPSSHHGGGLSAGSSSVASRP